MKSTRQQFRAQARAEAFREVTAKYGLEPRRARRRIALRWARERARKQLAALRGAATLVLVLGWLLGGPPLLRRAFAQGTRKDDIVINARGLPVGGASVAICAQPASTATTPCSPLALIYSNAQLTQALVNPITTDGLGNYSFYAAPGKYTIQIYGPSITTRVIPDVVLPNDPSAPSFTTVTTSSGITAFSLTLSGNLTVSGSASVTLGLSAATLGLANQSSPPGAPAAGSVVMYSKSADKKLYFKDDTGAETPLGGGGGASLGSDNIWTTSQRFKGPVPWRDITAYGAVSSLLSTTGSITSGSTTLTLAAAQDFANNQAVMVYAAGPNSTLTAPTGLTVTPTDTAGTTTYQYQIVAVDGKGGFSPASAVVSITNGPATLSRDNAIFLQWNILSGAVGYIIYGRTSGSMTCIGSSYLGGGGFTKSAYLDTGVAFPCHPWAPAAPPTTAGAQALSTTISSGGGTTTLTLAAAAGNAATSQTVLHDATPAINAAIVDAAADPTGVGGGATVLIPPGTFWISAIAPVCPNALNGTVKIMLHGQLNLTYSPFTFGGCGGGYSLEGRSGGPSNTFGSFESSKIIAPSTLGAVIVMNNNNGGNRISHISSSGYFGHGIVMTGGWGSGKLDHIDFLTSNSGFGAPLVFDAGAEVIHVEDYNLTASTAANAWHSVLFFYSQSGATNSIYFTGMGHLNNRTVGIFAPGGTGSTNPLQQISLENIIQENSLEPGFIYYASGRLATLGLNAQNITLKHINYADPVNTTKAIVYQTQSSNAITSLHAEDFAGFATVFATNSANPPTTGTRGLAGWQIIDPFDATNGIDQGVGGDLGYMRSAVNNEFIAKTIIQPGQQGFSQSLLHPTGVAVTTSTTGGTLAAGTYFYKVTGLDENGGETVGSNEASVTTTGATSSNTITWGANAGAFSWKIYRGTTAGGESTFYTATGDLLSFTDTGAAGTAGTVPLSTTAAVTNLNFPPTGAGNSWLAAGFGGFSAAKIGIGTAKPIRKLHVRGSQALSDAGPAFGMIDTQIANKAWFIQNLGLSSTFQMGSINDDLLTGAVVRFSFNTSTGAAAIPGTLAVGGGTALASTNQTGTGSLVLQTSPTLTTPVLGVATGTSLNLGATGVLSTTAQSGTGSICMTTSCALATPSLTTPSIGGETVSAAPRAEYAGFLPGALTSTWTGASLTLDKAITVTRIQVQAKTAPAGCTTNAIVQLTDGTTPKTVTVTAAANDSLAFTQNYAAAAVLTIGVSTAAAGCTANPADANVVVQYRMQ